MTNDNIVTKSGLTKNDFYIINSIISSNANIEKVILFGSRAKGTYHNGSDIDICLITSIDFSHNDIIELQNMFSSSDLPYTFDIIDYKSINNQAIKEHINLVGISIYQKKPQIRWKQRLENFKKALNHLNNAVELHSQRQLSELEKIGMLKAFEFTYELAWNVMKDFFTYQGFTEISGSRDAIRMAFQNELIIDGTNWMKMITERNLVSHVYEEQTADNIIKNIISIYAPLFNQFSAKMSNKD